MAQASACVPAVRDVRDRGTRCGCLRFDAESLVAVICALTSDGRPTQKLDSLVGDGVSGYDDTRNDGVAGDRSLKGKNVLNDQSCEEYNRLTIEMPCPPMHVLPVKTMFEPLLIARQSSWL